MDRQTFLDAIRLIQEQFDEIAGEGNAKVLDEVAFMRLSRADINREIYIVVRYGAATTNYGQTSIPISLTACGYINRTDAIKTVLTEYALTYNLYSDATINGEYCIQYYNTPTVIQNFTEIADGFCSLFSLGGYIVLGEGTNHVVAVTYKYQDDGEEKTEVLKVLSSNLALTIANNTQPKLAGNGFATSVGQYATMSVSFSTYLTDSELLNELLGICDDPDYADVDRKYKIGIQFKNGIVIEKEWRLASFSPSQNLGALPMATIAFTL